MYDFTFSIPNGVISIIGSVIGLLQTQSPAYVYTALCGVTYIALSVRSIKRFFRGMLSPDGVIAEIILSGPYLYLMHKEYEKTGNMNPRNLTAMCAFMLAYYFWNLAFGPRPLDPPPPYNPPKKHE